MGPAGAWPYPRMLAHRGGGALAPENTLAALAEGHARGYRAAEFDAVLTADEVPVLLHDATLDRTTDGHGCVADWRADELAHLDAGRWFAPAFAGVRVPTLEQALQFCWERGIWLNIEIKPVRGHEVRTGEVVAACVGAFCARCAGQDAARARAFVPLLSSFAPEALAAARARAPELPRGLLVGAIPAGWRASLQALDAVTLHCDHRALDQAGARAVRGAGYGLLCYTVNDAPRAHELARWGVHAVCTDRIDTLAPDLLD